MNPLFSLPLFLLVGALSVLSQDAPVALFPTFTTELPHPPPVVPIEYNAFDFYEIHMVPCFQQVHPNLTGPSNFFCYQPFSGQASYPGPTLRGYKGRPVVVQWANELPKDHIFPIDHTLHGAMDEPDVKTIVHLHGAKTVTGFDGWPEFWYTSGASNYTMHNILKRNSRTFTYFNDQRGTMLFYHDHALGTTRVNVQAGLIGAYLLRDEHELRLHLPRTCHEVVMLIKDHSFFANGTQFYPSSDPRCPSVTETLAPPEFYGNTILVNGVAWPRLTVDPDLYRLRIVNGANARTITLNIGPQRDGSCSVLFKLIGTDQGLVREPADLCNITLAPAERVDVLVNFKGHEGEDILLGNVHPTADNATTGQVLLFHVKSYCEEFEEDVSMPTGAFFAAARFSFDNIQVRRIELFEVPDPNVPCRTQLLLGTNGTAKHWSDPVTECPQVNTTEFWDFVNPTDDEHPIHLHLVSFLVVGRYPINGTVEDMQVPFPEEIGWKDTVRCPAGMVTRIATRFDIEGYFPYHCHILEHEDNEMMRPFFVSKDGVCPTPQLV